MDYCGGVKFVVEEDFFNGQRASFSPGQLPEFSLRLPARLSAACPPFSVLRQETLPEAFQAAPGELWGYTPAGSANHVRSG